MQQPSRANIIGNILYLMIPLFGFYLIEKYWGLQAGIVAAIMLAFAEMAWVYYREKRIEPFMLIITALIVIMGGISWYLESALLLLLKPAIFEGIFALLFLCSSLIGKPFLETMAKKQFGSQKINAFQMEYFKGVNWRIGLFFLAHAAMTVYAAVYLSKDAWFFVTGIFFYIFFFVYFLLEMGYSRFKAVRYRKKIEGEQAFLEYQRNLMQQIRQGNKK